MSEHTPTPWTANPDGWQPWPGAIQILGADGYVIAYTATGGPEKENAEHLVRSASSNDALINALENSEQHLAFQHKWLSDQFDAMGRIRDEGSVSADTWDQIEATYAVWKQVRAALLQAALRRGS